MEKAQKECVVEELTERLQQSTTLLVADYRGLSMSDIDGLRTEILKHGATFRVVKNTLTRRAAEAAGQDALLALLEGPTAIAFLESDGDPVAVAKSLRDFAKANPLLVVKGGYFDGNALTAEEVGKLADLESREVLLAKLAGAFKASLFGLTHFLESRITSTAHRAALMLRSHETLGDAWMQARLATDRLESWIKHGGPHWGEADSLLQRAGDVIEDHEGA